MYSDYIPDAVLDELREMGYNVSVSGFRGNDTIDIENEFRSYGFYFYNPASDPTRADEIKRANKQNIKSIKSLLNL